MAELSTETSVSPECDDRQQRDKPRRGLRNYLEVSRKGNGLANASIRRSWAGAATSCMGSKLISAYWERSHFVEHGPGVAVRSNFERTRRRERHTFIAHRTSVVIR